MRSHLRELLVPEVAKAGLKEFAHSCPIEPYCGGNNTGPEVTVKEGDASLSVIGFRRGSRRPRFGRKAAPTPVASPYCFTPRYAVVLPTPISCAAAVMLPPVTWRAFSSAAFYRLLRLRVSGRASERRIALWQLADSVW